MSEKSGEIQRINGKFAPGQSGNPAGKPLGTKSFQKDFDEVIEEIAKTNKITISEARKILLKVGFTQAKGGNYNFWKEVIDRYYGKTPDSLDLTSGGEKIGKLDIDKLASELKKKFAESGELPEK